MLKDRNGPDARILSLDERRRKYVAHSKYSDYVEPARGLNPAVGWVGSQSNLLR
jgi:hypothetical protein